MKFTATTLGLAALALAAAGGPSCRADETTLSLGAGAAPGAYTGTLSVSLSSGDWTGANWAFGGTPLGASVALPGSASPMTVGLQLVTGTPGQLYISGGTAPGAGAGGDFVAGPAGGASGPTDLDTALDFQLVDTGFYVPLSWDGTTGSWVGSWQVNLTTSASVPDSGASAAFLLLGCGGLAGLGARLRRPARAGRP